MGTLTWFYSLPGLMSERYYILNYLLNEQINAYFSEPPGQKDSSAHPGQELANFFC